MEITISLKGIDGLVEAICQLAAALRGNPVSTVPDTSPVAPPTLPPVPPVIPTATAPVPPVIPTAGVSATTPIPTSHVAETFTLDQIQLAMAGLVETGRMPVIQELMSSFGVVAITQLPKEQYPAIATKLRMAGARI